ncbi:MAG: hypothetical protein AB7I42_24885 [Bradyrhizobium sp.]|uniref:phage tail assembly chaperone n=1 Tax=Bradyrhizobium sp. TaxID=376 RepID=UPI003D1243DC
MGGAKKSRRTQPERPECPWQFVHVWQWFWDILNGCANGMGPATIGWLDLQAWRAITGERPEPWEVRLLFRLSVLRASIEGEENRKKANAPGKP